MLKKKLCQQLYRRFLQPEFSPNKFNVIGIGADIVYVPRIKRLLSKNLEHAPLRFDKIARKFMHEQEIIQLRELISSPGPENTLAYYVSGVWAVKEAIYKSMASEIPLQALPPAQVLYTKLCYKTNDEQGRPHVEIDYRSMEGYADFISRHIKGTSFKVSISHDRDYVMAFICHVKN